VPFCFEHGIGQVVFSPLAQGVLTGKYKPGAAPLADSRATDEASGQGFISWLLRDEVLEPVAEFAALAKEAGFTPAEVALAWILENENVSSAIIGATRPEQVKENVKAVDIVLEADLLRAIDEVLEPTILRDPAFIFSPESRPDFEE